LVLASAIRYLEEPCRKDGVVREFKGMWSDKDRTTGYQKKKFPSSRQPSDAKSTSRPHPPWLPALLAYNPMQRTIFLLLSVFLITQLFNYVWSTRKHSSRLIKRADPVDSWIEKQVGPGSHGPSETRFLLFQKSEPFQFFDSATIFGNTRTNVPMFWNTALILFLAL
jgi:hypothetical protein